MGRVLDGGALARAYGLGKAHISMRGDVWACLALVWRWAWIRYRGRDYARSRLDYARSRMCGGAMRTCQGRVQGCTWMDRVHAECARHGYAPCMWVEGES